MKPIHTLTWAVSAPILLFAGASHAINISDLTDPACGGIFKFDSAANKIMCDTTVTDPGAPPACTASASPSTVTAGGTAVISATNCSTATSWAWTDTSTDAPDIGTVQSKSVMFNTAGTFTYTVVGSNTTLGAGAPSSVTITVNPVTDGGSACASGYVVPKGTTIIPIGGSDYYQKTDFDVPFDNDGTTFNSAVAAGQSKALEFSNNRYRQGVLSATTGSYGAGYKDWAVSLCPGDFTASLGAKCVKTKSGSLNMYFSTDGSTIAGQTTCKIPVNQPVYLNVRGTDGAAAGWVGKSISVEKLP